MKKLNAAFCFSGQLRTWKECYPTWKIIFEYFDTPPDIYCHIWDFNTKPFSIHTEEVFEVSQEEISEYINTLKPKKYLVESYSKSEEVKLQTHLEVNRLAGTAVTPSPYWMGAQFYGIDRASTLKEEYESETGTRYDIVFRMRNDLYFDDIFLSSFYKGIHVSIYGTEELYEFVSPEPFTIYNPHSGNISTFPFLYAGDVFFFSDSTTYDLLSKFWLHLPYIFDKCFFRQHLSPEHYFYFYIKSLFLEIRPLRLDVSVKRTEEYFTELKKLGKKPYNCDI